MAAIAAESYSTHSWRRGSFPDSLDDRPCCKHRRMGPPTYHKTVDRASRYAHMLSAMGTEPRLRIMRLLLSACPDGLVVGEIRDELDIPNSTLSHHLEKLKGEELVHVRRESTCLRYSANIDALRELLRFLFAECCIRSHALTPEEIVHLRE